MGTFRWIGAAKYNPPIAMSSGFFRFAGLLDKLTWTRSSSSSARNPSPDHSASLGSSSTGNCCCISAVSAPTSRGANGWACRKVNPKAAQLFHSRTWAHPGLPKGLTMNTVPKSNRTVPVATRSRKGIPNKVTGELKAMILEALDKAGGVNYLLDCALNEKTQGAFLSLIGKVLPMTIAGDDKNPLQAIVRIERVIVDPKQ